MAKAKLRGSESASGEVVDPRWPAHLHINLAPEARGTGVAMDLMRAWQDWLANAESPGCYLQTLVENTRATRFFEKCGFVAHGSTPLVPGVRHQGQSVRQLTMVWSPTLAG
jgi:RimJ/RimL family protein N-acetyltransferase